MYYFIFEQPITKRQHELSQQIEDAVVAQGIAGELVVADVYTDIDELLASAHHKGFQTVVVVGGNVLINQVAARLIRYEMVFGIIPTNPSPALQELTGTTDWQSAVAALKRRRWHYAALGRLNDTAVFLARASIQLKRTSEIIRLTTANYSVQFNAIEASLFTRAHSLKDHVAAFECKTAAQPLTTWQRLRGQKATNPLSRLADTTFLLESDVPLDILQDGETIATTPVQVSTLPRAVRLITGKRSSLVA